MAEQSSFRRQDNLMVETSTIAPAAGSRRVPALTPAFSNYLSADTLNYVPLPNHTFLSCFPLAPLCDRRMLQQKSDARSRHLIRTPSSSLLEAPRAPPGSG